MPRGRPAKTIRPVRMSVHIPEDVVAAVELQLYSELEQRVPHGAWARLLEKLLREHLKESGSAVKALAAWVGPGPVTDGG